MGVDCYIQLPGNVRVRDVGDVIGILSGVPAVKRSLGSLAEDGAYSAHVEGVNVEPAQVVGLATITVTAPLSKAAQEARGVDEQPYCLYHFEPSECERLIMPRSTGYWLAIGYGLIQFFGGTLICQDCDEKLKQYHFATRFDDENCPEDGREWQRFQDRKLALKPLKAKDFLRMEKYAAYKLQEASRP